MLKTYCAAIATTILHLICCSLPVSAQESFDFSAFQQDPVRKVQQPPVGQQRRERKHSARKFQRLNDRSKTSFTNANSNSLRQYALDLLNADRKKHGSAPVLIDEGLNKVAQSYAEYLAESGFFGHIDPSGRNPQQRATLYGVTKEVSENLAWGSSNYQTPEELVLQAEKDMMAEPPNQDNHRSNIIDPRNKTVGIGVAVKGDKLVLVQEFSIRGN